MPGSPPSSSLSVYQLRVVLRGISPLIWRRLLVRSNSTIADLHVTLQLALGWSDEHLNRFVIYGREYDVTNGWQHDVRVEQILLFDPGQHYPICIGGRRAAPPEDCGGPWAFLELRQHYSVFRIADRLLELLKPLPVANDRRGEDDGNEHHDDD